MAFIGDAGEKISFLKYENDSPILKEEIKASMGYGIRMYLGSFLHLKFDWAWRTNLKTKKGSYFHFGIGSDF
jgi:outer membrane protein assembly factor BamA